MDSLYILGIHSLTDLRQILRFYKVASPGLTCVQVAASQRLQLGGEKRREPTETKPTLESSWDFVSFRVLQAWGEVPSLQVSDYQLWPAGVEAMCDVGATSKSHTKLQSEAGWWALEKRHL